MEDNRWVKYKISPQQYHNDIMRLIQMIPPDKYEYVYPIPRGGLVVGTYISYHIGLDILAEYNPLIPKSKILIADDIADTGSTLCPFDEEGYDTATIYYKSRSCVKPTYYSKDVSGYWIIYPYEKIDEPVNREP